MTPAQRNEDHISQAGGFSGDLRFVMKFPKSPPKNRNRENWAKCPPCIPIRAFSAGLWAQKTPCTRAFLDAERNFLCFGDSGAERSQFELSGDFHLARNFKVPSEKSKQRESCQMAPHHREWTFLCGTLGSENAVHAGISRRRPQFSLLRRLGCGGGGIRTHEGLSSLPVFKTGAFNHSATSPSHIY